MKINDINRLYFDDFAKYAIGTRLTFVWFPKTCTITGKTLWLEYAYKRTLMFTGPGEPVYKYCWYDKNEFLIQKIKGTL